MKVKSFSKINLSLRVLKKLKSGLHNIETNSALINLFDEITIKKNYKNQVLFKGKFKKKVNHQNNSVLDTLKILKEEKIISHNYKILIKKNIPVFAGLGGGTSNSASIIKFFLKKKINEKLVNKLEKKIGTDFRLFLNTLSFQSKLGKVSKLKVDYNINVIVIFPHIDLKTKNVYKLIKNFSPKTRDRYLKSNSKEFFNMILNDRNDLQKVVEKKYPKISKLIKTISEQNGCSFARMSGSGSACYGVFKSKKYANLAINKLRKKYPKYWCVITKTI